MTLPVIRQIEGNKLRRTLNSCIGNICVCLSRAIEDLLNGNASHGSGEKGLKQHWVDVVALEMARLCLLMLGNGRPAACPHSKIGVRIILLLMKG